MRRRDVRAILFCLFATVVIAASTFLLSGSWLLSGVLTVAWLALILTRPRMIRVLRRLRGETVEAFSYHRD